MKDSKDVYDLISTTLSNISREIIEAKVVSQILHSEIIGRGRTSVNQSSKWQSAISHFPTKIGYFRQYVKVFGPFSDYLITPNPQNYIK